MVHLVYQYPYQKTPSVFQVFSNFFKCLIFIVLLDKEINTALTRRLNKCFAIDFSFLTSS